MNTLQQMIAHGATHIDTEDLDCNPWMKRDIDGWHYWDDEYDAWDHCFNVTEDKMLLLPDDQPAPYWADAPAWADWDGQGLPPVGIECEVCTNDSRIQWQKVTVLAHDEHRAIFRDPLNKSIPTVYDWGSAACFRPLPTPDARRAEVVKQALATYKNADPDDRSRTKLLEVLYDAGMLILPEDT